MSRTDAGAPVPLPEGIRLKLPGRGTTFIRRAESTKVTNDPIPTVFLLHGWTVNADLNWFTAYESLRSVAHVVAIDHRGHGQGIRSRRRFRLADCADDVAAVCEELGITSIIPVGYSMGGPIAMLTWHRHRHLVDGLVLCATSPYFRGRGGGESTLFSMLPLVGNAARLTPRALRERVSSRILGGRADGSPVAEWARVQLSMSDPAAVADAGASLGRFDSRPWLGDIDVPTVVVRTLLDSAVPPARQTLLGDRIPEARIIDVNADHGACVMAWDRFVPAVVRGVGDVTARGTSTPRSPAPPR